MKKHFCGMIIIILTALLIINTWNISARAYNLTNINKYIQDAAKKLNTPGMSIVIIENGNTTIKTIGYADKKNKMTVTSKTKFELASCSKSFTALAALKLENMGRVNLNDSVSKYLPWFYVKYKGKNQDITLNQLLHHTSGIPTDTIFKIPISSSNSALKDTVKSISGIELRNKPGEVFEYATINFDIIGAVIEEVTKVSYEEFMEKEIFMPLGLLNTSVGKLNEDPLMAKGYKISFFKPRLYEAPTYRGNNPAGYIISNAEDMERWLKIQLGLINTPLNKLIEKTHTPDRSATPNSSNLSSYALGWFVYQDGEGKISHSGLNPNYTSYIAFRPEEGFGVVVLANSNTKETISIGQNIIRILNGNEIVKNNTEDKVDKLLSILSISLALYVLFIVGFLGWAFKNIKNKKRMYRAPSRNKIYKFVVCLIFIIPLSIAIYLLPQIALNANWAVAIVWAPMSLPVFVTLAICAATTSCILYIILSLYPHTNKYIKDLPC